jgi:hypothetical protein
MSKKVLIRKQQGIQYQQMVDAPKQRGSLARNLATLAGGAIGLNAKGGQGFVSGQGQAGRPTRMQRLGAGANLAGRGLAAALTGLQTAHSLQGGNVGAIASARDQYRANVGGLTGGQPTEMQRTQDMATGMYNTEEEERLRQRIRNSATEAQRSLPQQPQPSVPLPTSVPNANSAPPPLPPAQTGVVNVGGGTRSADMVKPIPSPAGKPGDTTGTLVGSEVQPAKPAAVTPIGAASVLPPAAPAMFQQPAPAPAAPAPAAPAPAAPAPAALAPVASTLTGTPSTLHSDPLQTSLNQHNTENPLQPAAPAPVAPAPAPVAPAPVAVTRPSVFSSAPPSPHPLGNRPPGMPAPLPPAAPTNVMSFSGVPEMGIGQGQEEEEEIDPRTGQPTILKPVEHTYNPYTDPYTVKNSFTQMIFNEFGDMLRKADPHVAGLLAMRIYMDKFMR